MQVWAKSMTSAGISTAMPRSQVWTYRSITGITRSSRVTMVVKKSSP